MGDTTSEKVKEILSRKAGDNGFVPGPLAICWLRSRTLRAVQREPGKEGEIFGVNLEALRGEAAGPFARWRDKNARGMI